MKSIDSMLIIHKNIDHTIIPIRTKPKTPTKLAAVLTHYNRHDINRYAAAITTMKRLIAFIIRVWETENTFRSPIAADISIKIYAISIAIFRFSPFINNRLHALSHKYFQFVSALSHCLRDIRLSAPNPHRQRSHALLPFREV